MPSGRMRTPQDHTMEHADPVDRHLATVLVLADVPAYE